MAAAAAVATTSASIVSTIAEGAPATADVCTMKVLLVTAAAVALVHAYNEPQTDGTLRM